MVKAVVLLKRKQDLSREAFIEYYETKHVPLVRELLPSIGNYSRNYLHDTSLSDGRQEAGTDAAPSPYFDVITEIWFENDAAYRRFILDLNDPETSRQLQEDESKFLDRSIVQTFQVDEHLG